MAKLSKEEQEQLDALTAKAEAPDEEEAGGGVSHVLNVAVDLGDEKQVGLARKLGFFPPDEEETPAPEDEVPPEEEPQRRGFFKES